MGLHKTVHIGDGALNVVAGNVITKEFFGDWPQTSQG